LYRSGERIKPRVRVICTEADDCGGTVERLEHDGFLAVVRTDDGGEAWVPVCELVRVAGRKSAATTT
jgi:class 3 adenylate cyclase